MRRIPLVLILAAIIQTHGCADKAVSAPWNLAKGRALPADATVAKAAPDASRQPTAPAPKPEPLPHLAVMDPRKVVYTAEFSLVVRDVTAALKQTRDLARRTGGYLQNMTNTSIVIRVPADKFDLATDALAKIGTVTHRDIKASDVTEAYMDLQIRIDSAKALLNRLLELQKKAPDIETSMAIEREAGRVRTQIERMMGQMNRMANLTTYATISVTFTPTRQTPDEFKMHLPLWWLHDLGLETLLKF